MICLIGFAYCLAELFAYVYIGDPEPKPMGEEA